MKDNGTKVRHDGHVKSISEDITEARKKQCLNYRGARPMGKQHREVPYIEKQAKVGKSFNTDEYFSDSSDCSPNVRRVPKEYKVDARRIDFDSEVSTPQGLMQKKGKRPVKRQRDFVEVDSPAQTFDGKGVDIEFHVEGGKRIKSNVTKQRNISSKEIWLSSDSDDAGNTQYPTQKERFANVKVKKSDCYYRSNMQTTVKEIKSLTLTEAHLHAIKLTPFWFLVNGIRESDEDTLVEMTKKHESDMRTLVQRFDILKMGIPLGESAVEITKRDLVLIFGVIDGKGTIKLSTNFEKTPWMIRCFPEIMRYKGPKSMPSMKKFSILTELRRMTRMNDKLYAQDVARLIHCYLLAALFMPNGNTSIPWCICEYLEDFSSIGTYDWSTLIVSQLNRQMATTRTMKIAGCAMLLPYWLCEHTRIISPCREHAFPRFMRWNLNNLHLKLYRKDLDTALSRNEILIHLKPTNAEKAAFKELNAFQIKSPVKIDVDTPRPAYESNAMDDDYTMMEETATDNSEDGSMVKGDDELSYGVTGDDECEAVFKRKKRKSSPNDGFNNEEDITCSNVPSSIQYEAGGCSKSVHIAEKDKFNSSTDAFIIQQPTLDGWNGNNNTADCYGPNMETDGFIGEMLSDQGNRNPSVDDFIGNMISEPYIPKKYPEDIQLKMEKKISLLNDEILQLRDEVKKMSGDKVLSDIQMVNLRMSSEEKDKEIVQLRSNISCLNDQLTSLGKGSGRSAEDDHFISNLMGEAEMLKEQNKKMLEERDKINSVIHDLKYDLDKCAADYELKKKELEGKICELERSNENIRNEYSLLEKMKDEEVCKLEGKVKLQVEKIDDLTRLNGEMDSKIQLLNTEIVELNGRVNLQQKDDDVKLKESELIETKRWLSELKIQYDTLFEECECMKRKYNEMQSYHSRVIQDLESTIQQKDDAIQIMLRQHTELTGKVNKLTQEKEDFERKCNELMNPSYTQVFNSSQSHKLCDMVAELNDEKEGARIAEEYVNKLLEELDTRNGKIKKMENIVKKLWHYNHNNMKVPSTDPDFVEYIENEKCQERNEIPQNNRKGKERVVHTEKEKGSIERGVKQRDDRKPKAVSPLGKEIVKVVDTVDEYPQGTFHFRWDRNCWAVAKCGGAAMEKMRVKQADGDNSPIWSGEGPYAKVYVVDALKVLHDETLSYMIVDAWGELLTWKLAQIKKPTKVYVFTSHSLDVLQCEDNESEAKKYFDLQLKKCINHEVLVFPLRDDYYHESEKKSWTMLKYQMRTATWTYYNPQSGNKKAISFNRVNDLITYIEMRLKNILVKAKKNIPLAKMMKLNANPVETCSFTPQKVQGSLDSGVIVCHIMEKTLKKHSVSSLHNHNGVYLSSTAGNYRCRMVESFISPETMKDMN